MLFGFQVNGTRGAGRTGQAGCITSDNNGVFIARARNIDFPCVHHSWRLSIPSNATVKNLIVIGSGGRVVLIADRRPALVIVILRVDASTLYCHW
jgi:hypothetical protein